MRRKTALVALLLCALAVPAARADVYAAAAAVEKQDFARAFELYREVAELGRLEGQENMAVSYVNGEGVKRDNVLGYAWARIARENGGGVEMQKIIDVIEPRLTDAARLRAAELQAMFGKEALQKTLLPVMKRGAGVDPACTVARPGNPADFYPAGALERGMTGSVILEFKVGTDGRAHHPRVLYGIPAIVFDEAGRLVVRASTFKPKIENGVAVPCTLRLRVKFSKSGASQPLEGGDFDEKIAATHKLAVAGDPQSQLLYGLILLARPELDTEEAPDHMAHWLLRAAQAGIPAAQFMIGNFTLLGFGIEADVRKGRAWLERAAAAGQVDAQLALANYLLLPGPDADVAAATGWLEKASASGNREAGYRLAALFATSPDPAKRDPQRALELLAKVMDDVDTDPTTYEIRAAAKAALGNFEEASRDQKRAIAFAKRLGWDPVPQRTRLDKYESGVAWTGDLFAL